MDGLWIINVNPPGRCPDATWFVLGGMAFAFAIVVILGVWDYGWPLDGDKWFAVIASGALMSILGAILGGVIWSGVSDDAKRSTTTYDVLISDEVKMNEFNEKYEIVSQNGNIYTIKEREK